MPESTLNYLAELPEKPYYYMYAPPPAGEPSQNVRGDRRRVTIDDARALEPPPSLAVEGFTLGRHRTAVDDFWNADLVRRVYYPEIERLVRETTGASRVVAFDHNVRSGPRAERREQGAQAPVRFAHNDYTEKSGPQRVRDLLPDEAEALLRHRFAVINVWKPMRGPVVEAPFAFCDARTIEPGDFAETDLRYRERTGEIYSLRYNPKHRWLYYPRMEAEEVVLLKCYDSARDRARFTAHTAFDDPATPPDAPPRESIEVRTLAFFD